MNRTSRKQQAAELRSTWTVYEPRKPGTPFTRRDLEGADERERANARIASLTQPYPQATARSAIGNTPVFDSGDSGSNPDGPTNAVEEAAQVPMRE